MTGKLQHARAVVTLLVLLVGMLAVERGVAAEAPQFRIDIDNLQLQQGVSATLVFSMVNARGAKVKEIRGLEHFDVLSNNYSSSTQIANGEETYQEDIQYVVMPKQEGTFTLQGVVEYDGSEHLTNELEVEVRQAAPTNEAAEDVFVRTILSGAEIFFGQKIILTYELYTRLNITGLGFSENVGADGLLIQDVPEDQLQSEIVYLDGVKYAKYEAKKAILTPVKSGTFTLPAYTLQVNVGSGGFFNLAKPVYLQTESKELTVKPLPTAGKPDDFSGVVGQLQLEASYSSQTVPYGDSVTLLVAASGSANLDSLKEIVSGDMPGFTVYQTAKGQEERVENNQYVMTKQFEVILVPKTTGQLDIEPIPVSYFNPDTVAYEQAVIPGTTIAVTGELPQTSSPPAAANGTSATETVVIDQVDYSPGRDGYVTFRMKRGEMLAGLAGIAGCAAVAAISVPLLARRKRADKSLQSYYAKIKRSSDPHEIYNLFNAMMKECCGISLKANSRQDIALLLADRGWAGEVAEIMDMMELGKYCAEPDHRFLKAKVKLVYQALKKPGRGR